MSALLVGAALLIGVGYGYVAQRGAFCMNSGFRVVVTRRDMTRVKSYGLAVAIQMSVMPLIFLSGASHPNIPAFFPIGGIVGGLLFGASMGWAGGCAAGVWYKVGAGNLGALVGVPGMAMGAAMLEIGPLSGVRERIQSIGIDLLSVDMSGAWMFAPIPGVLLLGLLWRAAPGKAGAWSWQRTGMLMGVVGLLAWPVSSLTGRDFGMAVVPGTVSILTGPWAPADLLGSWDVLFVLGIPVGAYFAARRSGPVRIERPAPGSLPKLFVGGLGLGVGASLAAGCTVGHGLTGVPLLGPGSILVIGAIFAGSTIATLWRGRG